MKKLHGIFAEKDGSHTLATLVKSSSGWQLCRSQRWELNKAYKRYFLFHSGIHLGLECHWVKRTSIEAEKYATTEGDSLFTACVQPFQIQLHTDSFEHNLLGIHPDDLYLCTLPLNFLQKVETSFFSIYQEEQCWKIALIIERKLTAVFSFPRSETAQLHCCMARIEQYWSTLNPDKPLPGVVYCLNKQKLEPGEHYSVHSIELPAKDLNILKAMGVAFCEIDPESPRFSGPTKASELRKKRSALYFISALLVSISLLSYLTLFLVNSSIKSRIGQCQSEYERILTDNKDIRDLLVQGESLAAKLKRIEKLSVTMTSWSRFLHQLGEKRPPRLFFERLGSEPVLSGADRKVRVVISGWADNETTVTELIKNLNTSEIISQISLSSMERDNKQKDYCRFKIVCTLTLSKN